MVPEYLRRKVYIYRSIFTDLRAAASRARAHEFTHTRTRLYPRVRISRRGISSLYVYIILLSSYTFTRIIRRTPEISVAGPTKLSNSHVAGALNDCREPHNIIFLAANQLFLIVDRRKDKRRSIDSHRKRFYSVLRFFHLSNHQPSFHCHALLSDVHIPNSSNNNNTRARAIYTARAGVDIDRTIE